MANPSLYCVKCKKKTGTRNVKVVDGTPPRISGTCTTCGINKQQFTSRRALEGMGLASMLGIPTSQKFKDIPVIGKILG